MWHEARKQERKIRGIMVDYKRRAERRQQYYEKMRLDPHQLLRIYGQKSKMHLSIKIVDNVEEVQLVPWQGDPTIKIDRFDVRSHLDAIDIHTPSVATGASTDDTNDGQINYERYRSLVQIEATGASEETYLKQLEAEEVYGKQQAEIAKREKEKSKNKASIGYTYEDSTVLSDDSDDSESDSDLSDIDIAVDVTELTTEQKESLDNLASQYGIKSKMYCQQLLMEKKEIEFAKQLEQEENERSKLSGRRGKRARRTLRERQKARRETSPPSYAVRDSPTYDPYSPPHRRHSSSSSSSRGGSPKEQGKIEFITEFVGAGASPSKTNVEKPCDDSGKSKVSDRKQGSKENKESRAGDKERRKSHDDDGYGSKRRRSGGRESNSRYSRHSRSRSGSRTRHRSRSRSRSRSRHGSYRRRSRSRSRENRRGDSGYRYGNRRSYSRSRSQSRSRRSRSRSKERSDRHPRSRSSRSRSRERSDGRHRSRSPGPNSHRQSGNVTVAKKLDTSNDKMKTPTANQVDKSKITPQEKLKMRMAKLLNKQIKDDKKEEIKKKGIKEKERVSRENEMLEIQRKRRQREREQYLRNRSPARSRSPSPRGWRNRPYRNRSSSPE